MANNITIKDSTGTTKTINTIEDSVSAHYNMSIPVNVSGLPIFTTVAPGIVCVAGSLDVIQSGTWTVQPGNTANTTPWNVSVGNLVNVSISPGGLNIPVSIANVVNVSISPAGLNIPVSIAPPTYNFPVSVHPVTQSGNWSMTIGSALPAGTSHLGKVSVEGLAVGGGITVSVGGAVSVQSTPMSGRDTGGNARQPLYDTDGTHKVGGFTTNPEYVFTRPTDVAPYAVGDLVANSTVAGTVIPMSWPVSRIAGGGGSLMVRRARLVTSNDNRTADRNYRLHLFNVAAALSASNGDNGVFAPTQVSSYLGYLDIPMHLSAATGAAGIGTPYGSEINITLDASQVSISGFLESRVSILPASGATYRTTLELIHN